MKPETWARLFLFVSGAMLVVIGASVVGAAVGFPVSRAALLAFGVVVVLFGVSFLRAVRD